MSRKRRQEAVNGNSHGVEPVQKRRREYSEQDVKLAKIYDDLANEVKEVRIGAAASLVQLSSEKDAPVHNILQRLIRGLCSGRKAARSGFSVALTEVLRGSKLTVDEIIDKITTVTQPEGKVPGQEKRDYLFGRVFGYKAVIQSSIIFSSGASPAEWEKLLDLIFELAQSTPILREECGLSLYGAVEQLASQSSSHDYAEKLVQKLCDHGLAKTSEGVAIWIGIMAHFPQTPLPKNVWYHDDPVSSKNLSTLASVLREDYTRVLEDTRTSGERLQGEDRSPKIEKIKGGVVRGAPSFAWDVVIEHIFKRTPKKNPDSGTTAQLAFSKLWNTTVDESLFAASASSERKALGFQLLTRLVSRGAPMLFPAVFSKNLMHCLINQRSDPERYLHDAAKAPLDAVRERVKNDPKLARDMLAGLLCAHGDVNFDHITRTKTVDSIMAAADNASLEAIVSLYQSLMLQPDTSDERIAETRRRILSDHLLSAVRSRAPQRTSGGEQADTFSFLKQVLMLFVRLGYCRPILSASARIIAKPPISATSQSMFQSRLSSCLTHIMSAGLDQRMSLSCYVVSAIHSPARFIESVEPVFEGDKAVRRKIKRAFKMLDNISSTEQSATGQEAAALRAFKLLYSLTLLQVFNGDTDAVSMLDDIETCYGQVVNNSSREEDAMKLLLEVLLSFIAKPSVLFRRVAEQVFVAFASELTEGCLESLIDVLSTPENMSGQRELFEQEDETEDRGEASDDDADASDGEVDDDQSTTSAQDESSDESTELTDDSQVADESDDGGEELAKFNAMLAEAMKTARPDSIMADKEAASSDEDMDDEQMMALEPHLTKIFQERKKTVSKKHVKKVAKETIINFKGRVLDLLTIYVKQQHANRAGMSLILPLVRLVRTTGSKHISEKSFNLLKTYFDSCKGNNGLPAQSPEFALVLLESVHDDFMLSSSKIHVSACSRASLFTVKVLLAVDPSMYAKVAQRYAKTQTHWHSHPRSKMMGSFFTEWISWSIATSKGK